MALRSLDPIQLAAYRTRQQNLAFWLFALALLIGSTVFFLGITKSDYSFENAWKSLVALQGQGSGAADGAASRVLLTDIIVITATLIAEIALIVFAARAIGRSRVKTPVVSLRRQSYLDTTPTRRETLSQTDESPIVTRGSISSVAPEPEAFEAYPAQPLSLTDHANHGLIGASIDQSSEFERLAASLAATVEVSRTIAEPVPEPLPEPVAAPLASSPAESTNLVTVSSVPQRHKHRTTQVVTLPSRSRLTTIVSLATVIGGLVIAVAFLATNSIFRSLDAASRSSAIVPGTETISPTFSNDIMHGALSPQVALLWLITGVILVLGLQVWALTSIARIMLSNAHRRADNLQAV
jgi:hypothetical protein